MRETQAIAFYLAKLREHTLNAREFGEMIARIETDPIMTCWAVRLLASAYVGHSFDETATHLQYICAIYIQVIKARFEAVAS